MNKMLFGFFVVIVLGLDVASANAPAEISHSVDFPKGDAAWSVKFERISSKKTSSRARSNTRIAKTEIVRMGDLRRDTVILSDGTQAEYWWTQEPPFVFQEEANKRVSIKKPGAMGDQRLDASIFEWVDEKTFVKMESYKGRKCRFYKMEVPLIDDEKQTFRAWIDEETLRPLAWSNGDIVAVFSFHTSLPSEPLILPAEFQKEIDRLGAFFGPAKAPETP